MKKLLKDKPRGLRQDKQPNVFHVKALSFPKVILVDIRGRQKHHKIAIEINF